MSIIHFRIYIVFFCFMGFCSTIGWSQQVVSTQGILSDTRVAVGLDLFDKGFLFLNDKNQNMPLIDKLEFRTETDEWDFERQEYLFRSSFNSPKLRNLTKRKTANYRQSLQLKNQEYQSIALQEKFEHLTEWHFIQIEIKRLEEKQKLLKDKKNIFQKMIANSLVFEIDDLLKVDESLQELNQTLLQLKHQKKYIVYQLTGQKNDAEAFNLLEENWISLEKMQIQILSIQDQPIQNVKFAQQQLKINSEVLNQEEEKIESQKIIDFVQVKYSGRDKLELEKEFSIGFGINIPTRSSGRVKRNEAMLKMIEEEVQLKELEFDFEKELEKRYTHFQYLFEEYQMIKQYISENKLSETYKKYQSVGEVPPLSLLRIKESILKNERTLSKIEKEATRTYLEILKCKGVFSKNNKVNYLSDLLQPY